MHTVATLFLLVALTALSAAISPVHAQQLNQGSTMRTNETMGGTNGVRQNAQVASPSARSGDLQQQRETACQQAAERIREHLEKHSELQAQRKEQLSQLSATVQKMLGAVAATGVDVSKVQADLEELQSMVAKHEASVQAYTVQLRNTISQAETCVEKATEARKALQETRTQYQALRTEAQAIRSFIQTTLRPDLQAVRTQLAKMNQEKLSDTASPGAAIKPTMKPERMVQPIEPSL